MEKSDAHLDTATSHKLSLTILDEAHYTCAAKAITNVLATDIAEATFAQIVDGVPLWDVLRGTYVNPILDATEHPVKQHTELCPGALEKTRQFRSEFQPDKLTFDSRLLMAYQAASPGSRSANTRLIEIVAGAIHQIAVIILRLNAGCHKDDNITSWTPCKNTARWWRIHPGGAPPTLFYHRWYMDYQQYPEGAADMAGYWAETRILGGVALFDKFEPESDAVFLHPDRILYTYRIYQLLDDQKRDLLDFLVSDDPLLNPEKCPLPILPSKENKYRIDPEEDITATGIYRDEWERNQKPFKRDARHVTRWDILNWPTLEDWNDSKERWHERRRQWMMKPEADFDEDE